MICAYCGTLLVWPEDFPLRTEAKCFACIAKNASISAVRGRGLVTRFWRFFGRRKGDT